MAAQLLERGTRAVSRLSAVRGGHRRTERRRHRALACIALAGALLGASAAAEAVDPAYEGPVGRFGLPEVSERSVPRFWDIDGDGDLDAFIGQRSATVVFLENTGDVNAAAFAPVATNPFGLSASSIDLAPAFADIDGDGDLDAFFARGNFRFFPNTGSATAPAFGAETTNPFGLAFGGSAPTFVDIDADGDLDVLDGDGVLRFFENTGSSTAPVFAPQVGDPFGWSTYGDIAHFADVDGDGDIDALQGRDDGVTVFVENTGSPTAPAFASEAPFGLPDIGYDAAPVFVDIDGDADLDLFLGEDHGISNFFENTGSATNPAFLSQIDPFGLPQVYEYAAPAFADIDGDGDLDAIYGDYSGNLDVSLNTGTANLPAFAPSTYGVFGLDTYYSYGQPTFVDIDGDGDLEVFTGEEASYLYFSENTGNATSPAFAATTYNPFGISNYYDGSDQYFLTPAFVDIDGDGDFDLFMGAKYSGVFFVENTGDATTPAFAPPQGTAFDFSIVGRFSNPTFVDIEGDGDFDAFVGNEDGVSHFFRNTGSGTAPAFAAPTINPFGLADIGAEASIVFADIDADGVPEAFIGDQDGNTFFFEAEGPTRALTVTKASARVAPASNGLVKAKGTFEAASVDVSAGLTLTMTDGGSMNVTGVVDPEDCTTKSSGKIKCRARDPINPKKKVIAVLAPSKKNPGTFSYKLFMNKLDLPVPLAGPINVTIDENSGGTPFQGSIDDCASLLIKLVCK